MIELAQCIGFTGEAGNQLVVGTEIGFQLFDRDRLAGRAIAAAIHLAHPALIDQIQKLIPIANNTWRAHTCPRLGIHALPEASPIGRMIYTIEYSRTDGRYMRAKLWLSSIFRYIKRTSNVFYWYL